MTAIGRFQSIKNRSPNERDGPLLGESRHSSKEFICSVRPSLNFNNPINPEHAYFGEEDFHIMDADDFALPMEYYGAVDLAISDKDKAAYTRNTLSVTGTVSGCMFKYFLFKIPAHTIRLLLLTQS